DAAEVGMAYEAHSEQIEDFTLEEIYRGPESHERFNAGIAARHLGNQPHTLFSGMRKQVIDHLKARLGREDIYAGDVAEKIELRLRTLAQSFAGAPDVAAIHVHGQFVAIQLRRFHQAGILKQRDRRPAFQLFKIGDCGLRHLEVRFLRRVPVERAFLPYIEKADQHDADVHQHLPESEHARAEVAGAGIQGGRNLCRQFAINHCPGNQEDRLNVEKNEQHGNHVKLDGEALASIARAHHAAFVSSHFGAAVAMFAEQRRERHHASGDKAGDHDLHEQRDVIGVIGQWLVRHKGRYTMCADADVETFDYKFRCDGVSSAQQCRSVNLQSERAWRDNFRRADEQLAENRE